MLHFSRWKVIAILAVVLAGVAFALPNVLPKPWQDTLPARLVYIDASVEFASEAQANRSNP